jgi:hypothetical protein
MAGTAGSDPERGRQSRKPRPSRDRGLQLALVNVESLVTACHQRAVNTSLPLAHTARRTTQGSSLRGPSPHGGGTSRGLPRGVKS